MSFEKFNQRNFFTRKRVYVEFIEKYIKNKDMQKEYISYLKENTERVLQTAKVLEGKQKH